MHKRLFGRCEAVDAGAEHRLHGGRNAHRVDSARQLVGTAPACQVALLHETLDDLLDEERVAAGPFAYQLGNPVEGRVGAEKLSHELVAGRVPEGKERELATMRALSPGGTVLGTEGGHHQLTGAGDAVHQVVQERLAGGVQPVKIFDEDHERRAYGAGTAQAVEHGENLPLPGVGVHVGRWPLGISHAQEVVQQGKGVIEGGIEVQDCSSDLRPGGARVVLVADPEL